MPVSQSKLARLTPNLGILWILVCSFWLRGSILANPIIYRLVPSPSRYEIRQLCIRFQFFLQVLWYLTSLIHDQLFKRVFEVYCSRLLLHCGWPGEHDYAMRCVSRAENATVILKFQWSYDLFPQPPPPPQKKKPPPLQVMNNDGSLTGPWY